ncbi:hypothetical protein G6F47_004984 [Rhizopus delemar]|nr:hypothetical protein G6F54_008515 [Rhizopus delemar]KAG1507608.1 hypothetical protein G6F53_008817 [Rhizopus delemar]KAG1600012.1 hypothetical protein G6F47_004984 [Rhizopus delemar]
METIIKAAEPWCSSKNNSNSPVLSNSPEEIKGFTMHSDDFQPTSALHSSIAQPFDSRLVVVGSYKKPVTLGRGGASTIKIGRRNRQISRIHVSIEFNAESQCFQLTILGLNGANIDYVGYNQNAIVVLEDKSFIDVLGDHIEFRIPPGPTEEGNNEHVPSKASLQDQESGKDDIKSELDYTVIEHKEENTSVDVLTPNDTKIEKIIKEKDVVIKAKEEQESLSEEKASEEARIPKEQDEMPVAKEKDYSEIIIDALVFSRASSMAVSDIFSRIIKSNPDYAQQPRELWIERIRRVLKEKPFFGEIQRKGKTADGSPKENLYYYNSELDPVEWRRSTYTQVGRSARKCTLKDKQYFWKIPPKLGRHRSSYVPPPTNALEIKGKRAQQNDDNESSDSKKIKL